jgi:hypothetical protein
MRGGKQKYREPFPQALRRRCRAEQARAGDGGQRPLVPRSRCPPRLTRSVRWPARRVVSGASYPSVAVGVDGGRGVALRPGIGGGRGAARRPGSGGAWPRRSVVPPPNNALEPTAPSGRLCPGGRLWVGAAAHRER